MKTIMAKLKPIGILLTILFTLISPLGAQPLWNTMKNEKDALVVAQWFTAQEVDHYLSGASGLDSAVNWCKQAGITKVYLEAFGRGLFAKRETLIHAKTRFLKEGFAVGSGVTTTKFGKDDFADDWKAQCYTNKATQQGLQRIFEYAASMFDEIIIDDWYFTNCKCEECMTARGEQTWEKYYGDLMVEMSRERVMKPAHAVNPNVKVIIKFPQWYDQFHMRGYEVLREPKIFDGIWVGTEARNFDYDTGYGYETGYNAYFNMRWLATLGSVGGGWFDTGGDKTKVTTYLEQARHTVLGNGNKMILWSYSAHLRSTPKIEALSKELPGLIKLAKIVHDKPVKGVHLPKPGNSDPFDEVWICSFLGNLGIPLVPASKTDESAVSAVFTVQALKDSGFVRKFQRIADKGTPVVITDGFAKRMSVYTAFLNNANVTTLPVNGSPKSVLKMTREQIKPFRDRLLAPMGIQFDAPSKVELYFFGDNYFVVENVNEEAVDVTLELPRVYKVSPALVLPEAAGVADLSQTGTRIKIRISPNSLIAVEYH